MCPKKKSNKDVFLFPNLTTPLVALLLKTLYLPLFKKNNHATHQIN